MKMKPIQIIRWVLIGLLFVPIGFLVYSGVAGLVKRMETDFFWPLFFDELPRLAILLFAGIIPAVMLYSLFVKRLYGFACGIGLAISLSVFFVALTVPHATNLLRFLSGAEHIPQPFNAFLGVICAVGLTVLPFWLFFRLMHLTIEWAYPKFLKPLESRL